ncbi:hypothetical protein P8452_33761 [Trifolium repens]|nr:hypothetical protein P8452_33761 [Trifolium repens]
MTTNMQLQLKNMGISARWTWMFNFTDVGEFSWIVLGKDVQVRQGKEPRQQAAYLAKIQTAEHRQGKEPRQQEPEKTRPQHLPSI